MLSRACVTRNAFCRAGSLALLLKPAPRPVLHLLLFLLLVFGLMYGNPCGFPGGSVVKNPPAKAGDTGSIPGLGRSPGGGNGNPLQCSCLGTPMDRGAWRATVHGVEKEWDVTERLNDNNNVGIHGCRDSPGFSLPPLPHTSRQPDPRISHPLWPPFPFCLLFLEGHLAPGCQLQSQNYEKTSSSNLTQVIPENLDCPN